ncbi:TPA: hypothetical protein QH731_004813 [Klebsiella variicola]|jgi:chorismate mutase|uniref:hypothetical protein n=1 Tax=Klebsiella TaxID=570 RepID=UPI0007385B8E|nr:MULTISPECIES: hypothetical protein [Klebsiella]DAT80850.1 MAG TPA: hypothetical protein [Caudoviricetes sp.]HBR0757770.1 hypothetical protein [Klebsiella quasipneumoniae]HCC2856984.1 hypothetical protein [Klebsiella variicola]HDS9253558.1 hypothetical protein [Klebsiella pneumoniae subsp. pneumoniae]HDU4942509.1 hypothetical protein [Klebsiella pneumoniae subsp. ozaenae]
MNRLERMYYPLSEASKELGYTVKEILHLGATERIEICAFIPRVKMEPVEIVVHENEESVLDEIRNDNLLYDRYYTVSNMTVFDDSEGGDNYRCKAEVLSGFFALYSEDVIRFELSRENEPKSIELNQVSSPFTSSYDFNVLFANGVKVDIEELVIMADVLNDFDMAKKPKLPSADGLNKKKYNSNKQSQLIKALIRIHYSEADSNNPRSLLEDGGEILNDMTKLNIRPPVTGKTLKSWLDDVDIDYLEISR